jgi:hypothetical protein
MYPLRHLRRSRMYQLLPQRRSRMLRKRFPASNRRSLTTLLRWSLVLQPPLLLLRLLNPLLGQYRLCSANVVARASEAAQTVEMMPSATDRTTSTHSVFHSSSRTTLNVAVPTTTVQLTALPETVLRSGQVTNSASLLLSVVESLTLIPPLFSTQRRRPHQPPPRPLRHHALPCQ